MNTRALLAPGRFERRLQIALAVAFIALASLLVGLGVWLEQPFRHFEVQGFSAPVGPAGDSVTEVAK
jgi:hypothetical protein